MRVLIEGPWRDEELPQDVGRAELTAIPRPYHGGRLVGFV